MPASVQGELQLLRHDPAAGRLAGLVNRPEIKARAAALKEKDNEKSARYHRLRRLRDPLYCVLHSLRGRIRHALKTKPRADKYCSLIGCTPNELKAHLQRLFRPGMCWQNYGAWEVDHIRPCCSFDLAEPDEQYACFHFSNLQPLWASDNRSKGGKWHGSRD